MAAFVYQMNPWVEYKEPGMGWSMMMGLSASDWIETRLSVVDLFVLFQRIAMRFVLAMETTLLRRPSQTAEGAFSRTCSSPCHQISQK